LRENQGQLIIQWAADGIFYFSLQNAFIKMMAPNCPSKWIYKPQRGWECTCLPDQLFCIVVA